MSRSAAISLRQSPTAMWASISVVFLLDYFMGSRLTGLLLPAFLHSVGVVLELIVFAVSTTNTIYFWTLPARKSPDFALKDANKLRGVNFSSSSDLSARSNASAPARLDFVAREAERAKHLSTVSNFLGSFFVSSSKANTSSASAKSGSRGAASTSFTSLSSSSISAALNKDTSLGSTLGYHDSPMNRSLSSVYTHQQLSQLLAEDTCDSIVDTSTHVFDNSFCDEKSRVYQVGTYTADEAANRVTELLSKQESASGGGDAAKSPLAIRKLSDSLGRYTRESSPLAASLSAILSSSSSTTTTTASVAGGGVTKQRRYESELMKLFAFYGIHVSMLDDYELKLRVWIRNTIVQPLVQKVDELNEQLAEKFASTHLRVGVSTLDALRSNLSSRPELCNTYLPFVLPYLRFHANQHYLTQRFRALAADVTMEEFRWNGGGAEIVADETNGLMKMHPWSDRLPTDTELIWSAFCAYMDYLLAPCPNYGTGEFFKPFSNVYFLRADSQHPTAIHTAQEAFFIRMATAHPPLFEFVCNGGTDVIVPNKESGDNFWLVILLFLAHVQKFNFSRIGHLHLSTIALNIFDV